MSVQEDWRQYCHNTGTEDNIAAALLLCKLSQLSQEDIYGSL